MTVKIEGPNDWDQDLLIKVVGKGASQKNICLALPHDLLIVINEILIR